MEQVSVRIVAITDNDRIPVAIANGQKVNFVWHEFLLSLLQV
jgi:hypothetical protein